MYVVTNVVRILLKNCNWSLPYNLVLKQFKSLSSIEKDADTVILVKRNVGFSVYIQVLVGDNGPASTHLYVIYAFNISHFVAG